jgi:hypothetical protein
VRTLKGDKRAETAANRVRSKSPWSDTLDIDRHGNRQTLAALKKSAGRALPVASRSDPREQEAAKAGADWNDASLPTATAKTTALPPDGPRPRTLHDGSPPGGHAIPEPLRAGYERYFARDLGHVRLHTDPQAGRVSEGLSARAVTVGRDIYFSRGRYDPNSSAGRALLGHELSHALNPGDGETIFRDAEASAPSVPAAGPAPSAPPVVWGMDTSTRRPYVSVAPPGCSIADVANYVYTDPATAIARLREGGAADPLQPGAVMNLPEGALTDRARADLDRGLSTGLMMRTEGVPASEAVGEGPVLVHTFSAAGQTYSFTTPQFRAVLSNLKRWIATHAQIELESAVFVLEEVRNDFLEDTNSLVRWVSDELGDAELPPASMWTVPRDNLRAIIDELNATSDPTQEQISRTARGYAVAKQRLENAERALSAYMNDTASGAGSAITALEVTRDVSFAVAAGIGGAVAAPLVFGAATAVVGTGVVGTTVAVGTTIGVGGLTGSAIHGGLELSSATAGQALTSGPMDWDYVQNRTLHGLQAGFSEGAMGAASFFAGAAVASRFSVAFASSVPGRLAIGGIVGSGMGFLESTWQAIFHPTDEPAWRRILRGTLLGGAMGAGTSLLPINGLYRSGGTPGVPFTGTPVTPRWMMNSPWSPVQRGWSAPREFNALRQDQLPPLPDEYCWGRLGDEWVPLRSPRHEQPLTLSPYVIPGTGRLNYNLSSNGRLLGSSAWTRPAGSTYPTGRRGEMPFEPDDFVEPISGDEYIVGHNVDYADTAGPPGIPTNSNADPLNYTPEPEWWGLRIRNPLVARIRAGQGGYRQMNYYSNPPRLTRSGVPIPDGVYFVEFNNAGVATQAWRVPYNAHPLNHPVGPGNAWTMLANFNFPVAALPSSLRVPPPLPTGAAAAGAGALSDRRR